MLNLLASRSPATAVVVQSRFQENHILFCQNTIWPWHLISTPRLCIATLSGTRCFYHKPSSFSRGQGET